MTAFSVFHLLINNCKGLKQTFKYNETIISVVQKCSTEDYMLDLLGFLGEHRVSLLLE